MTVRVIVIDPFLKKVTEEQIEPTFEAFYARMSPKGLVNVVKCIEPVRIDSRLALWVDEEGQWKLPPDQAYFHIRWYSQPLAGICIVAKESERHTKDAFVDCAVIINAIERCVSWVEPAVPPEPAFKVIPL